MINREWQIVQVLDFVKEDDEYGFPRQKGSTSRDTEMVVKIYNQSNVSDVRYVNVQLIGITKDKTITDKNKIVINNENYDVLYVVPSSRYYSILMRKAYD